jgi:putative acyl-CoA dehydrogenase
VAFLGEIDAALGADRRYDSAVARLRTELTGAQAADPGDPAVQFGARRLVEQMALMLQASLLVRHGHPAVADGFCASRLGDDRGHTFGALPAGIDVGSVIERARVKTA